MKAAVRALLDFVAWRWAPTVALVTASLLYVLIVVGLVPTEIQVPIANPRFDPKPAPTATATERAQPDEAPPPPAPSPAKVTQANFDFGRRGFSPPIARPDPPAPPAPPPPVIQPPPPPAAALPPAAAVAGAAAAVQGAPVPSAGPPGRTLPGRVGGILQSVTNALAPLTGAEPAPAPSGAAPNAAGSDATPPAHN